MKKVWFKFLVFMSDAKYEVTRWYIAYGVIIATALLMKVS